MAIYYNIEPFHFAFEDIVNDFPKDFDLSTILNTIIGNQIGFGILLDDTGSQGIGVKEKFIAELVASEDLKPCVEIYETYLTPIVLSLLTLIPKDDLLISSKRVMLRQQKLKNPCLLLQSNIDNFDCRELIDNNNSLVHDIILKVKPTCVFFTIAWYYFRLLSSWDDWEMLSENGQEKRIEKINEIAERIYRGEIQVNSHLYTILPKVFAPNEEKENLIISKFRSNETSFDINSGSIHTHYYY